MAVLVIGSEGATLRLKLAYVAWDENVLRATMEALRTWP